MGMYDSFSAEVVCPCGNVFYGEDIQSKDFDCNLDHLKQGERTDKKVERFFYADSSMGRKEGRWEEVQEQLKTDPDKNPFLKDATEEDFRVLSREEILEKYGDEKKYDLKFDDDGSWHAYSKLGFSKTVFDGIHGMDFNCYTSCPKCKKWLDMTGVISEDVFVGVTDIITETD